MTGEGQEARTHSSPRTALRRGAPTAEGLRLAVLGLLIAAPVSAALSAGLAIGLAGPPSLPGFWPIVLAAPTLLAAAGIAAAIRLGRIGYASAAGEARLRAILDSDPDCVKSVDSDCRLIDMNAAGLEIVEVQRLESIVGASVLDLIDPKDREAYRAGVAAVFRGEAVTQEFDMLTARGKRRRLEQRAVPLHDPARPGRVREMLAITRDVTEQVRAREALSRTARDLDEAQRIGNMGSWTADVPAGRIEWSEQIYRIFGYVPGEIAPSFAAFLARVHPDDRAAVEEASRRAKQDRRGYDIQHRIIRPDGEVRTVHERAEVEFDAEGRAVRMAGTVQDISMLRDAEERLGHSEATLRGILTISPEGIVIADARGRITLFSVGAESIFGYAAEEVIGQPIECLMPERFRVAHRGHFRSFAASAQTSRRMGERAEITGRRKDGTEFPAEASLSKIETRLGAMFTTIVRDISAQKAANDELVGARLRAEAANEAKSRFIANMSHELRTPLNAVIGFSSILMDDTSHRIGREKFVEYAGDIFNSAQHLLQVINDILEISSIEIGKFQLSERPASVDELLAGCLRMVELRAQNSGIELATRISPAGLRIHVDPRLFTQAVLNLLSNAVKFTDRGGRVEAAAELDPRGGLVLQVRDSGIGMSPEDAKRVGEPFLQLDNRLSRKFEGSGLGLAIVKQILRLHGGEMSIDSEEGRGTTVTLRLPAERVLGFGEDAGRPARAAAGRAGRY